MGSASPAVARIAAERTAPTDGFDWFFGRKLTPAATRLAGRQAGEDAGSGSGKRPRPGGG